MENESREIPALETLFAAALYLATKYARTGCPLLCRMVIGQLACIENHPSEAVPRSMREACRRLSAEWERIGIERPRVVREAAAVHLADTEQIH